MEMKQIAAAVVSIVIIVGVITLPNLMQYSDKPDDYRIQVLKKQDGSRKGQFLFWTRRDGRTECRIGIWEENDQRFPVMSCLEKGIFSW